MASGLCSLGILVVLQRFVRAKVVADVVERHDASQFDRGHLDPYFLRHRWTSMLVRHLADGVIVISRRLAVGYAGMPKKPMLLPPLVDLADYGAPTGPVGPALRLVYVGNPRGKDRLGILMDAIQLLEPSERSAVRLTVAGPISSPWRSTPMSDPTVSRRWEMVSRRSDTCPGRWSSGSWRGSDFSVLLRPTDGYAAAGFPSKVPESLAAGCPVLCNLTTDLGNYLVDEENAIDLSDVSRSRRRVG